MTETKREFYHSKGRLLLSIITSFVFSALGILVLYLAYDEGSIVMILVSLFIIVLFAIFFVANTLKLIRNYPYLKITDQYIQLDPFTKSEATIYFDDIKHIKVSKVSSQNIIEIVLHDEDAHFAQLSFHNKMRLCMNRITGFTIFTLNVKAVPKQERGELLQTIDLIIQLKLNNEAPQMPIQEEKHVEKEFMKKYDAAPPVNRTINRSYFLKSYGKSLFIFAFFFIFIYMLIGATNDYLLYIIISFILYPIAKVSFDWLFGFKLRHWLDHQKGFIFYFEQLLFIFESIVFHVSIFLAPIGMLFLIIRHFVRRKRQ